MQLFILGAFKFFLVYRNLKIIRNGQLLKSFSQSTRKKSPAPMGAVDSSLMVLLYLSRCGPRNSFRVLYWHIPMLNKQVSTEWNNQLPSINLPACSRRGIKTPQGCT